MLVMNVSRLEVKDHVWGKNRNMYCFEKMEKATK